MRNFDENGMLLARYQGKLFEQSLSYFDCSSLIFVRRFIHSELAKQLDRNSSSTISLFPLDGLESIKEEYGETDYGTKKYSKDEMFWCGYLYRYISYTRNISTKRLFELFKFEKVISFYYVYHTQDLEWCFENLCEYFKVDKDEFNPREKMRKLLVERYKKLLGTN